MLELKQRDELQSPILGRLLHIPSAFPFINELQSTTNLITKMPAVRYSPYNRLYGIIYRHFSRHFLTTYFVFLGNYPIFWKYKKQAIVSRSSSATCELFLLKHLLTNLGFLHSSPAYLHCDRHIHE
ncbi:unnamed protein product [Cuscuta epithymum]|uniref:Uncharacterized protein n=1 Tax=Cuscuta epithymum TaxID=186058 RepID=A0AAV0D3G0_9ASTE|nr:unnamed protein product [Cuscuta epithymum]CAH9120922.1 unnamed protein product [Cuscuta epithymum]